MRQNLYFKKKNTMINLCLKRRQHIGILQKNILQIKIYFLFFIFGTVLKNTLNGCKLQPDLKGLFLL